MLVFTLLFISEGTITNQQFTLTVLQLLYQIFSATKILDQTFFLILK